jgi:hypothetical protein
MLREEAFRIYNVDYLEDETIMKFENEAKAIETFFSLFDLCLKDQKYAAKSIIQVIVENKDLHPKTEFKLSWENKCKKTKLNLKLI